MSPKEAASHRVDIPSLRLGLSPLGPWRRGACEADLLAGQAQLGLMWFGQFPLGAGAFEGNAGTSSRAHSAVKVAHD